MKPRILSIEKLAQSRLFTIERLHLHFSNGAERHFERICPNSPSAGAVMIVPMLDAQTLLLVREYGVGIDDYFLGFPKGVIEADEEVIAAANRELMEETGYGARSFQLMKTTSTSPGYIARNMHLVLAQDLYECRLEGDEPEPLEVVPWPLARLSELLTREDFHEARSIAALLMAKEILNAK